MEGAVVGTEGSVLFARQRIVDRRGAVVGWELLWRSPEGGAPDGKQRPDEMTTTVLSHLVELERRGKLLSEEFQYPMLWVNSAPLLLVAGGMSSLLPVLVNHSIVIELHESVVGSAPVASLCKDLKALGARIALDDFVWQPGVEVLLAVADIVKLDLEVLPRRALEQHVEWCREWGVMLLAERVETEEQRRWCEDLGFDFFQGFLYGRPELIREDQDGEVLIEVA